MSSFNNIYFQICGISEQYREMIVSRIYEHVFMVRIELTTSTLLESCSKPTELHERMIAPMVYFSRKRYFKPYPLGPFPKFLLGIEPSLRESESRVITNRLQKQEFLGQDSILGYKSHILA